MPTITRIAFWNPTESRFGDYTPTPHRSLKEAKSTFALASTCIRNAALSMPKHPGSKCSAFWSLARVELVRSNGVVLESFALPRSARKAIAAGRKPNLKVQSAKEPVSKNPLVHQSLAVVAKSADVIYVDDVVEPAAPEFVSALC